MLVFLHGYGTYCAKMGFIAEKFVKLGYDAIGFDYPGFGYSEGPRGHIDTDNLIETGLDFLKKANEYLENVYKSNSIKYIAYGYSTGAQLSISLERTFQKTNGSEKKLF